MSIDVTAEWTLLNLTDLGRREAALSMLGPILESSGRETRFFNMEWRLAPSSDWSKIRAYLLQEGEEVLGFVPFLEQERPLKLHLGEVAVASARLTRYTMIGDAWFKDDLSLDSRLEMARRLIGAVLGDLGPAEAMYLEGLPLESPTYRALTEGGRAGVKNINIELGAPFDHQSISLPESFGAYLEQLGARSRKSLQYSQRRLEKDMGGEVRVEKFVSPDSVPAFVADASAVSRKTYQWGLLGLGLRDDQETVGRLRFAADRGWFRSYILYCRNVPTAFMLGHHYGRCYYYDDVGYDPEYAKWSVGSVLQLKVLEEIYSAERRPSVFDFSTGFGEHKARFANSARKEINILVLPRTTRNVLLSLAYKVTSGLSGWAVRILERAGLKAKLKKLIRRSKSNLPDSAN